MNRFLPCTLLILSIGFFISPQNSFALVVTSDATGWDAGYVTDYWGFDFVSGSGEIQSAKLTLDYGYFDFDGSPFLSPLRPGVEPIVGVTNGITIDDITYPRAVDYSGMVGRPRELTFSFAPGSFTAGDFFRFSADVDGIAINHGGSAGGNVLLTVTMGSGMVYNADFVTIRHDHSIATISAPEPGPSVPEPSSLSLIFLSLCGLKWFTRKKYRS